MMPRYRCHKEVTACKIAEVRRESMPLFKEATCRGCYALRSACGHCERCDWERTHGPSTGAILVPQDRTIPAIHVDSVFLSKHNPQAGTYYVRYEDGYESISPAAAFEAGYARIE